MFAFYVFCEITFPKDTAKVLSIRTETKNYSLIT